MDKKTEETNKKQQNNQDNKKKDENKKKEEQDPNTGKEVKKEGTARRDFLRKIDKEMQEYWYSNNVFSSRHVPDWKSKMSVEEKNKSKFLVTFPYPYMNGLLHLGHGFSLTKAEFQSRYQRIAGKNVLFPFSFHCTGMPIAAAANRIKIEFSDNPEDDKKAGLKQSEILKQMGIFPENVSQEEIKRFGDAIHWINFFPNLGMNDLKDFGLSADFTRSFVTTEIQKFYDKFIEWQFLKLKQEGKIKFGKRQSIFSIRDDQPCADHDRSVGEGVKPQEYTLVKLELLDTNKNENIAKWAKTHKIILPAATLRPETMYGQTNLFLLPNGEYGAYEMKNNEIFICSHQSAINMAYQFLTKVERSSPQLFKLKGKELIGCRVKAPLAKFEYVYILPMTTISMTKGTGVVTSVPSDSPDDYACLRDFQRDAKLRAEHNITEEMVKNFNPVAIIKIPELGDLAAVTVVEEMKIKDHKDKEKLAQAKEKVYLQGFYAGELIVGDFAGKKVGEAKPLVKNQLISSGQATIYLEPESLVISRGGDTCVVALVDQWYIVYGEESWKEFCKKHLNSADFKTYTSSVLHNFQEGLDWFGEWGCSRTFGNGSRIPWDKQYLIESLSDSTIYMALYTVYNYMAGI